MKLIIFNIDQGQCAYICTPGDRSILIDCGKSSSGDIMSPAEWLAERETHPIDLMIITHSHNSHSADIDTVNRRLSPAVILRDTDDQAIPDLDVNLRVFRLTEQESEQLGGEPDQIINNRSIVTIITYNSPEGYRWKLLIAGDNEANGWEALLAKPDFRAEIAETDFFIASNHGLESGFSADLFKAMGKPIANIISTRSGADRVDPRYRKNGQGVKFPDGSRTHFVTREDGNITVEMRDDGHYDVWLYTP